MHSSLSSKATETIALCAIRAMDLNATFHLSADQEEWLVEAVELGF